MPRQIFKKKVITIAGPPPTDITLENLRNWISLRKGRFTESFDEEVTHVLCTHDQFKKRSGPVKQVLKDHKRIHIVHYDWLEFSAVANKRLPERDYSMRNILAQENAERRDRYRQESGRREGERGVNPTLFHIYQDREFFSYQIDLTRNDSSEGEFGQRYTLTLWESNAKPHLYWFTAKFMRRTRDPRAGYHRPSPCSGKWRKEMNLFMGFFHLKTGIDWMDRVLLAGTTSLSKFQYSPPTGGKPVGRRLRLSYDACIEFNMQWKQRNAVKESTATMTENEKEDSQSITDIGRASGEDADPMATGLEDGYEAAEHIESSEVAEMLDIKNGAELYLPSEPGYMATHAELAPAVA